MPIIRTSRWPAASTRRPWAPPWPTPSGVEHDDVEATLEAFAGGGAVFNACDHYVLYLLQRLSP
jgi:hypothetical protein